jgi:hypothetical protein
MSATDDRDAAPPGLWDPDLLWAKAVLYAKRACDEPRESPWFPFFASLALEHLGRSVVSDVHPVLLADPRDEENLFYAFEAGRTSRPRSIPAHTVFSRCVRLVDGFTDEMSTWCNALAERRNEEVHTAGAPFASLDSSVWLPKLYRSFRVLCEAKRKDMAELLGDEEARVAVQLLAEADATTVGTVKEKIGRASRGLAELSEPERVDRQASPQWPLAYAQWDNVACPACQSSARVYGVLARTQAPRLEDGQLIEAEIYVRDHLVCPVCDLELNGHNELDAAGIAGSFTIESSTDPDDYYGQLYADRYSGMEEEYGND